MAKSKYLVTIADRVERFCPSCACHRFIYVYLDAGVEKTCCCSCQRVLSEAAFNASFEEGFPGAPF